MRTTARQLVYDYRHTAYRGYGRAFSGVNLRPDNPTPDKLAVHEQRQRELIPPIGKELFLAMLPGGIQRGAGLAGALLPPGRPRRLARNPRPATGARGRGDGSEAGHAGRRVGL
jgi:hypothetical protein